MGTSSAEKEAGQMVVERGSELTGNDQHDEEEGGQMEDHDDVRAVAAARTVRAGQSTAVD